MSADQKQLDFTKPLNSRESQKVAILQFLRAGNSLTPLQALDLFKCMRLGGRVYDLKKEGHKIEKRMVQVPSGKYVAEYVLVDEGKSTVAFPEASC